LIFGFKAKEMPVTSGKLKRIVKSKNFERHLNTVINTIRDAISASGAFESIAEQLKQGKLEEVCYTDFISTHLPLHYESQFSLLDIN
jgi:exosome complex exonuclease RRP6